MPRTSSVSSAAYYDALSANGTPAAGGGAGELDEDDPLMAVDLDDPLAQQELAAFGTGAVEEPLPAPPVDPNAAAREAAKEANAQAGGAADEAATAGAGGKRTLAASGPLARAKRPKAVKISPAKTGKQLQRRAATGGGEFMLPNNDFCDACGGKGHFLCCEGGCLRSFHFQCLEPPLEIDEVPDESWYCKACRAAAHPPPKPPRSYFSDLIYKAETENPKQFSLTNELKGFFKHVASGTSGEFIDSMEHRPPSKITGRAIGQEDRDGYRLKDKNGKSIICYNCDGAAEPQKQRRIISCDFCDQHWHLDCLDPPMTGMPPPTRKWMCPLHSEQIIPKKRVPKTVQTIPVDHRDQPNNGDIVIVPSKEKGVTEDVEEMVVNRVRYQVPEQHIILDFWGRVTHGPRSRRPPKPFQSRPGKNRSPRKQATSGNASDSSELSDLTSSDESDSDGGRAPAKSVPVPSALDNLALLAEVRYIDYLSSSSANGASASKDKGKERAFPPALPASTQRRASRPSFPGTPGAVFPPPAVGTPRGAGAASPSLSPAIGAGVPKLSEVEVETKEDLQALMRVRKMIQAQSASKGKEGQPPAPGDAAKRAAMIGFLEGEPIIPKLGFIKSESTPWSRPWEQQRGGQPPPLKKSAVAAPARPSPAPTASTAAPARPPPHSVSSTVAASAPSPSPALPSQPANLSSSVAASDSVPVSSTAVPSSAPNPPAALPTAVLDEPPYPFSLPPPGYATTKTAQAPITGASLDAMELDGAAGANGGAAS
ncbi:hypothetical protein JCM10213_005527 [Rhodosporidiobolus nylandii]